MSEVLLIPVDTRVLMDDDPKLREVSVPITTFDGTLGNLVETMLQIMMAQRALGLAAIQIGVPMRVIVVQTENALLPMVNPVITRTLNRETVMREGCLSVRGVQAVSRPAKCDVSWHGLAGEACAGSFAGLTARIIQHEVDHLNGKLITDHPLAK